jgi:HNH endonuclease
METIGMKKETEYFHDARMDEPEFPHSSPGLVERLIYLHREREEHPRPSRRLSLSRHDREEVLNRTDGLCHLCGGKVREHMFTADHVRPHALEGPHTMANYLPAHRVCNGARWFYSPEEFYWILRMGVWARKQMEDKTEIGLKMQEPFFVGEKNNKERRRKRLLAKLMKELSKLKVLDTEYEGGPKTETERDAHHLRQQRHQEITEEMNALAIQKQGEAEQNPAL